MRTAEQLPPDNIKSSHIDLKHRRHAYDSTNYNQWHIHMLLLVSDVPIRLHILSIGMYNDV